MTITAADIVANDPTFCCPLIGAYPCERDRRGCFCHELHLINIRNAEIRWRQLVADAKAEREEERRVDAKPAA